MLIILSQICPSELFVILMKKRKLNKDKTPRWDSETLSLRSSLTECNGKNCKKTYMDDIC